MYVVVIKYVWWCFFYLFYQNIVELFIVEPMNCKCYVEYFDTKVFNSHVSHYKVFCFTKKMFTIWQFILKNKLQS